jgi:limonene-1,2-epoxide hydrolase
MTHEQQTTAFFEQWGVSYDAMTAAFHDAFAPDCLWEQRPIAVTRGPEEAVRFLHRAKLAMGLTTIEVELHNVMSAGDIVFTERVDHLCRADGARIVSAPVAGILEWRHGRIVTWREYFDSASFIGRALSRIVTGAAHRVTTHLR